MKTPQLKIQLLDPNTGKSLRKKMSLPRAFQKKKTHLNFNHKIPAPPLLQ